MKPSRNDPCPCGSGKKYKHCCYAKDSVKHEEPVIEAEPAAPIEDDDADPAEGGGRSQQKHQHQKDRSRFKGEVQGKTSTFRPRATRGAQRGS